MRARVCWFMLREKYNILFAIAGSDEVAQALLDGGAAIDALTAEGLQPIHVAAFKGHVDIVQLLMGIFISFYYFAVLGCW